MKEPFDIISIGCSTLDVFWEIDEATVLCELEKQNCRFALITQIKFRLKK